VAGGAKSTTAEATRHLTALTRKTGAAADAGAAKLGDAMGSMRQGANVEAPPVAELDDILGQALSPADASSAKPAKPTDPAAVGTVLGGALGGLVGHGKR
jgi:hypothetical protein